MNEWVPLIVAIASLIGSGLSFYFSRQERVSKAKLDDAAYYAMLVADIRGEMERFREERDHCMKELEKLREQVEILERAIRGS